MSNQFCVFTSGNNLELLQKSCDMFGVRLRSYPSAWTSYVDVKLIKARDFLGTIDEEIVMWVDGHDSLVLAPEEVILHKLNHEFATPCAIAAERTCWPDNSKSEYYPPAPKDYLPRFLNSGGWIGPRKTMIETLNKVIYHAQAIHTGDDQLAWTTAFLADYLPEVSIDYFRQIFCSESDGDTSKERPCVRHWNGRTGGREKFWEEISR